MLMAVLLSFSSTRGMMQPSSSALMSHQVALPLRDGSDSKTAKAKVVAALEELAQIETYWKKVAANGATFADDSANKNEVIEVPQFGWTVGVRHQRHLGTGANSKNPPSPDTQLELTLDNVTSEECGWLCVRLLRPDALGSPLLRKCVDVRPLAKRVLEHYASLDPSPGEDAQRWSAHGAALAAVLPPHCLRELERGGVVVVENALDTFVREKDDNTKKMKKGVGSGSAAETPAAMALAPTLAAVSSAAPAEVAWALHRGFKALDAAGLLARTGQGPEVRSDAVGWFDDFKGLFSEEEAAATAGTTTTTAATAVTTTEAISGGDVEKGKGELGVLSFGPSNSEVEALSSALNLLRGLAAHLNANGVHGEPFVDSAEGDNEGDNEGGKEGNKARHGCASPPPPLPPATVEAPLTVPSHVMGAQYPPGGRYVPHSDNGLEWVQPSPQSRQRLARRRNHRQFTAIVYANSPDWERDRDGGCLKVYLGSGGGAGTACRDALLRGGNSGLDEAVAAWPEAQVVEVAPRGGTLVLFDARLVHEVCPSTERGGSRRALTMWVGRPVGNQARGEAWDAGDFFSGEEDEEGIS